MNTKTPSPRKTSFNEACVAAALLLTLCSCTQRKSGAVDAVATRQQEQSKRHRTALDNEAYEQGARYYAQHASHCGSSWYIRELSGWNNDMPSVTQFADVEFEQIADNLTESDRLNGIEWDGHFSACPKRYRTALRSDDGTKLVWDDWSENHRGMGGGWLIAHSIQITKKNGTWDIKSRLDTAEPVACGAVPH